MSALVDYETLDNIAATLALRDPNREAVESIAAEIAHHFDNAGRPAPFEGVVDSATGVGKTYVFAAALDYLARVRGVRNFVLIAPSRVILDKSIDQFTAGHDKAIIGEVETPVHLVTATTFASPATVAAMEDPSKIKLYVFTVQALLKPKSDQDKKTHKFNENLGTGFYKALQAADDLVIFADEHHAYTGPEFSKAVRELEPMALVGLTATPHKTTTDDEIIYRYPLAAAIADRYVKTPVIVGRKDDKADPTTQLLDGITLLEHKRRVADAHSKEKGVRRINSIMLVVAKDIDEAEEWASIVRSSDFKNGQYRDSVLVVHSRKPRPADKEAEELRRLQDVEHPDSPIRILVSVAMLKEGWDVKNVYVLLSTQPSLSTILTEQVLGRGLRLPWGEYTGKQMLDTLEVLAHQRYEELLRRRGVLTEDFVDYRIRTVLRQNAEGREVVVRERTTVENPVVDAPRPPPSTSGVGRGDMTTSAPGTPTPPPLPPATTTSQDTTGHPTVTSVEDRQAVASVEAERLSQELAPKRRVEVPLVRPTPITNKFSLLLITDTDQFKRLGERLRVSPEDTLRRTVVGARVIRDASGMKKTELVTETAVDEIEAAGLTMQADELRALLTDAIMNSPVVAAREDDDERERKAVRPILDAFFDGLNGNADQLLSAYFQRSTALLLGALAAEQRRFAAKPTYSDIVRLQPLGNTRTNSRTVTANRHGPFAKSHAYQGWQKSMYAIEWFDSEPERAFANLIDDEKTTKVWVRLHTGELPIIWSADGRQYNADFIVVETTGDYWIVEVKADNQVATEEVQGKRLAAKRWTNIVNVDSKVEPARWHYLLVSQTDINQAKGSWAALKQLGT